MRTASVKDNDIIHPNTNIYSMLHPVRLLTQKGSGQCLSSNKMSVMLLSGWAIIKSTFSSVWVITLSLTFCDDDISVIIQVDENTGYQ